MTYSKPNRAVTVLYRGTLQDTAALVGLVQVRAPIGLVAFIGELTDEMNSYCQQVNKWLTTKGVPLISIHPIFSGSELEHIFDCPTREWGWREGECIAAIRLAGLQLPPPLHINACIG